MKDLDTDQPLLLWGAERPFQLQLLAGLTRLGMDVMGLCENAEGKKLVDRLHPKSQEGLSIPSDFYGLILWAPKEELFSNSKLCAESLKDLEKIREQRKTHS